MVQSLQDFCRLKLDNANQLLEWPIVCPANSYLFYWWVQVENCMATLGHVMKDSYLRKMYSDKKSY